MTNTTKSFTFTSLPTSLEQLRGLNEATLDCPYKTAALTMLALVVYEKDIDLSLQMLNFLKGPEDVSEYEKQFIRERLRGKEYKARSFFEGALPTNNYEPNIPYVLTISENPYSFQEENWATLYVSSGGADSPRPIKLRKKPSTNQWFINDIQCLSDIRLPISEDKWA